MLNESIRSPLLDKHYQQFLRDENSTRFIHSVSQLYCIPTLEKLALQSGRMTRRAATLAVGFLSDFRSNEVLGRCLRDNDRAVRMLADHGIRQVWFRTGDDAAQHSLRKIARLNSRHQYSMAADLAEVVLDQNRQLPEAWNQHAIAMYSLSEYERAIESCQEAIYLNRFHFLTVVGMANAYLQTDNLPAALESFRLALDINPDLENIRSQIMQLEKTLDD
jgi:tetratricopeptide (TPR) repeat protein